MALPAATKGAGQLSAAATLSLMMRACNTQPSRWQRKRCGGTLASALSASPVAVPAAQSSMQDGAAAQIEEPTELLAAPMQAGKVDAPQVAKKPPVAILLLDAVLVCGGLLMAWHAGLFGTSICYAQTATANAALTWQEQYDLGVRYVAEGNYQEAIIAFTAAITIEPKQPEAYIALADVYIVQGDVASATNILAQGYAATQDEAIAAKQAALQTQSAVVAEEEVTINTIFANGVANESALLTADEVTLYGQSVWGMDIFTMRSLLENNDWVVVDNSELDSSDEHWWIEAWYGDSIVSNRWDVYPDDINALQYFDDDESFLSYTWVEGDPTVAQHVSVGMRDITMGDSLLSVYTALGFTNGDAFIAYLQEVCQARETGEESADLYEWVYETVDGTQFVVCTYSEDFEGQEQRLMRDFVLRVEYETVDGRQEVNFLFNSVSSDGFSSVPFDPTTAILRTCSISQD